MALAYVVVFVDTRLFDDDRRDAVAMAQQAADARFQQIAEEARLTMVTRNPEPRVMTYQEMTNAFPDVQGNLVGLYFTADIT